MGCIAKKVYGRRMSKVEEMSDAELTKEIKKMEKEMLERAKNLEFEAAARLRDQLAVLKKKLFGA